MRRDPRLADFLDAYAHRLPVRRIAVVGNAPLEPSGERRAAIDECDIVMRCNSFVVDDRDGPPITGRRTDAVMIARATLPSNEVFRDYRRRAYLVVDAGNISRVPRPGQPTPRHPASWPRDVGSMPVPNGEIGWPMRRWLSPETDGRIAVPTTGTIAIGAMHVTYPEADVLFTGFSFLDDTEQATWKHHYGTTVPVHRAHLLDREAAIIRSWMDTGRVQRLP